MAGEHGFFANPELWVLVSFLIFVTLFGKKLAGAVIGALDSRAAQVRAELAEAHKLRAEAEALLTEAKKAQAEAQAEAKLVLERAQVEATRIAEAAAIDAKAAAARRERMALDRISAAEKAAVADIRNLAADIATKTASDVIAAGLTAEAGAPLIDEAIASLPKILNAA